MDYQRRLARLRERMDATGIELVYLTRGANLFYLTGVRRHLEHGTDHNAYGDWACGALIGRAGDVLLLAPRMGGGYYQAEAEDKPWIGDVRLILERESPLEVLRQGIASVAGAPGSVALDERAWARTMGAFEELLPEARLSLASALLDPMRMLKEPEEIEAMRRASHVADAVFAATLPVLREGVSEYEVGMEVDYQFQKQGAEYTSFETGVVFVGAGQAAGRGTGRTGQRRKLAPGDSITFDFGCVLDGYCSDFGRSAFLGEPSAEYRGVHQTVLEAQAQAIAAMTPDGTTTSQLNAIARKVIADAGYDAGFTHRLGHGIGVTVHEPPFLDEVDGTPLQVNMAFTIEPSIRVPGKFGNRVEDVVIVTANGGDVLNEAPHDLVVVG